MRVEGWESLLEAHITEARAKPFQWGQHDCALWSASWAGKATGIDYTGGWLGEYATEAEAAAAMRSRGFMSPEDIANQHLPAIPVPLAQRGDLMLHPCGALGICHGRRSYFVTPDGLCAIGTGSCLKAWRVG